MYLSRTGYLRYRVQVLQVSRYRRARRKLGEHRKNTGPEVGRVRAIGQVETGRALWPVGGGALRKI